MVLYLLIHKRMACSSYAPAVRLISFQSSVIVCMECVTSALQSAAATRLPSVLLAAKVLSQADPYSIAPLTDNLGCSEWVFGQEREGIAT